MMRRRVRTAARWAGTAACVLLAGVWVGSWWYWASWRHGGPVREVELCVETGHLQVFWDQPPLGFIDDGTSGSQFEFSLEPKDLRCQRYWLPTWDSINSAVCIYIPLYLPLALTLLPTAWLWRGEVRRRRLVKAGGCAGCGYDRKGLAAGAVCPECGAAPSATS